MNHRVKRKIPHKMWFANYIVGATTKKVLRMIWIQVLTAVQ